MTCSAASASKHQAPSRVPELSCTVLWTINALLEHLRKIRFPRPNQSYQVGAQSAQMKMTRVPIHGGLSWSAFNEETTSTYDSSFTVTGLLEQLNTTRDLSDYLWYSTENWLATSMSISCSEKKSWFSLVKRLFIWDTHSTQEKKEKRRKWMS
ncbi:hypothetical protein RIF29_06449 [Crotalaria pallida]|uniref:Beta-galactosidase n=1 Tax=Crotalaria pallida TaxID=3830 RepID=A0AAN9J5U5_CROPI